MTIYAIKHPTFSNCDNSLLFDNYDIAKEKLLQIQNLTGIDGKIIKGEQEIEQDIYEYLLRFRKKTI